MLLLKYFLQDLKGCNSVGWVFSYCPKESAPRREESTRNLLLLTRGVPLRDMCQISC